MPQRALANRAAVLSGTALLASAQSKMRATQLGLVTYCFNIAAKNHGKVPAAANFSDPLVFIEETSKLGASAVQIPFGICEADRIWKIRDDQPGNNFSGMTGTIIRP